MAAEIERVFLLRAVPDPLPAGEVWRIEQGYLPPADGADPTQLEGRLRRVLPRHEAPPIAIHAVRPQGRHLSAKVRSFIDFLVPRFGDSPEWDAGLSAQRAPRGERA